MDKQTLLRTAQHKGQRSRLRRRGVLMLVVLSMLVLFMLIGTAFLMTSSQSNEAAKGSARLNRVGNNGTRLLDRALLHVLRDTDNPHSAIRYHSLLRDLYGTDGFQGVVYSPVGLDLTDPAGQVARFAGATAGPPLANQLGPTQGQFVDIYVRSLAWHSTNGSLDDPLTPEPVREDRPHPHALQQPDARHVVKLERNILDLPQLHTLPLTRGYYNGCLLTITSGPAAGQSARILDYEYVADIDPTDDANNLYTRLYRFRVMAFPRADGRPLQINPDRSPEIADLAGATFIVNGRPFNGTGVGYNPLAATGAPRLNALQAMQVGATGNYVGAEIALTPNSSFLQFNLIAFLDPSLQVPPFSAGLTETNFFPLNDSTIAQNNWPQLWKYQSFAGPGDADESYDAADFQNMFLALQTVSPRWRGRVVHNDGGVPVSFEVDDPEIKDPNTGDYVNTDAFLRLDLEDLPWPSFHRPDLVNFWYHRLVGFLVQSGAVQIEDAVPAVLHPYGPDGIRNNGDDPMAVDLPIRDFIVAIKRKIMLRPIREDHPHFDGSNPQSVPPNLNDDSENLAATGQISIPYWEAVGPWDVDNDNDGINDSVWVDIGDPIIEAEDGTRYKALYSYLIVDLDSRLNVNAHGLADHITPPVVDPLRGAAFDQTRTPSAWPGNLAHDPATVPTASSLNLPSGVGYGPAEISLRPVFPLPWANVNGTPSFDANRSEDSDANGVHAPLVDWPIDSYAALLIGRQKIDFNPVGGKLGFAPTNLIAGRAVTPGQNYQFAPDPTGTLPTGEQALPDPLALLKFFNYPWTYTHPSAFGTWPDLKGRYALGIDYTGQPVYEVAYDANPYDTSLRHNLLANSPYELDLSSPQRRNTWSVDNPNPAAAFVTSLSQNDDAPFATTDLERVLRAYDADSGTLPSRLWDVVDAFDPVKLMQFDPHRVTAIAMQAFGATGEPERLAAAQQIAAINRQLVTTDGFDLPVPAQSLPTYAADVGPDGQPGRAEYDGSGNVIPGDPNNLNAPVSDDFRNIVGTNRAQATIVDLLRYRVWLEFRKVAMREQGLDEPGLAGLSDANYEDFLVSVTQRTDAVMNGFAANGFTTLAQQILAPEVIAGQRMDLNRPFGDGRDNAGDGIDNDGNGEIDEPDEPGDPFVNRVVDDPLEAGDPFLDVNGNGKWDGPPLNEPYLDIDGNGIYSPPRDRLWRGLTTEQIVFDHTNGRGEMLHPAVATAGSYDVSLARVRNLDSQARQQYARHLYCLMLLLVDEGYIAPYNELDPQIGTYLDTTIANSFAANLLTQVQASPPPGLTPEQETKRILLRKLTCRTLAQWAINCVDMRDADAIMTPFEYDEDPWDGWGTLDRNGNLIPLDGDPATDENKGEVIDWSEVPNNPNPYSKKLTALPAADLPTPLNQTRGVVWGAERPELLITETLAFHDRRAEDSMSMSSSGGHDDFLSSGGAPRYYFDPDMDQGLRPWGRLFVELYNPWSDDGQRPAELYRYHDGSAHATGFQALEGVLLQRLTNFADNNGQLSTATGKRSPVWRMIVVEEWPDSRNVDPADDLPRDNLGRDAFNIRSDKRQAPNFRQPKAYADMAKRIKDWRPTAANPIPPFYAADPDFDEAFNGGFVVTQRVAAPPSVNEFNVMYPYIEREFYFTSDNSPRPASTEWQPAVNDSAFKLRIPDRSIRPNPRPPGYLPNVHYQTQRFIAAKSASVAEDVLIAPILPGRYAVVGSAGTTYTGTRAPSNMQGHFVTTIGRWFPPPGGTQRNNTSDDDHASHLSTARRIEMRPDTDSNPATRSDPNINQFLVTGNGGFDLTAAPPDPPGNATDLRHQQAREAGRSNELVNDNGALRNINDSIINANGNPGSDGIPDDVNYEPCVAIPVQGMSVSEPAWGWKPREVEAGQEEDQRNGTIAGAPSYNFEPSFAHGEGRYSSAPPRPPGAPPPTTNTAAAFDVQFDLHKPELMRTGTTANYRTIHLQRLANPLLPWNPPPGQIKDSAGADMHRPNLPINPYRTVDSSSVDLTAFNGVSDESAYPDRDPQNLGVTYEQQKEFGQFRPWVKNERGGLAAANPTTRLTYADLMVQPIRPTVSFPIKYPIQVWDFRSVERGNWAALNLLAADKLPPLRALWAQEPPRVELRRTNGAAPVAAVLDGRELATMRVALSSPPEPDANHLSTGVKTSQNIQANRVDMVMEHSLGFGNESFGRLYSKKDADLPTAGAVGAPRRYDLISFRNPTAKFQVDINSAYPWLAWNNRPVVSANELLQVPAASSSQLLRQYSTINPNATPAPADIATNPYSNAGRFGLPGTTPVMYQASFPFGHLLNYFAATAQGIDIADIDADNNTAEYRPDINDPTKAEPPSPGLAPHFYRILEYVHVPSRYVGTETLLNPDVFNDVPGIVDGTAPTVGSDIAGPNDPRYNFQPPFNQVSRERDPGRVNLNTITGRRAVEADTGIPRIWSEVYDGLMHRYRDEDLRNMNGSILQLGHAGPAWRDVVLSRRGYLDISTPTVFPPSPANPLLVTSDRTPNNVYPDIASSLLDPNFPSIFSNPFRSPEAGELVPLAGMIRTGVQAGLLRSHPYSPGNSASNNAGAGWGQDNFDDAIYYVDTDSDGIKDTLVGDGLIDDAREAGIRPVGNEPAPPTGSGLAYANDDIPRNEPSPIPLFSEAARNPFIDADRNPYMMYQPMTRLGNLVTNRSGVFAVWITVGYFEVEKAPNWEDNENGVQDRLGGNTPASLALYNRIYPDGYMLGREVGSDTGDVKRARGFYIIDRTEEVGFKPGDDLNVERTIRLRRRIE